MVSLRGILCALASQSFALKIQIAANLHQSGVDSACAALGFTECEANSDCTWSRLQQCYLPVPFVTKSAVCDEDTDRILSQDECDDVAKEIGNGVGMEKATEYGLPSQYYPGPGCIQTTSDGHIYYNTNSGTSFASSVSVCGVKPVKPEPCVGATCKVFEDPHIEVFDGAQVSLIESKSSLFMKDGSEAGDKWLVWSERVQIQARYVENPDLQNRNLFVRAVAMSGPFLSGHILIVGSIEDQITWDGAAILQEMPSQFQAELPSGFIVKANRSEDSALVEDPKIPNAGVNVELPEGVSLIFNRLHQHVNVAVNMGFRQKGQDGLCGNFNGVSSDDTLEFQSQRIKCEVPSEESFFEHALRNQP